jgi:hypothetical protein
MAMRQAADTRGETWLVGNFGVAATTQLILIAL